MTCNVFTSKLINVRPNTGMDLRKFFKPNDGQTQQWWMCLLTKNTKKLQLYTCCKTYTLRSQYITANKCARAVVFQAVMKRRK